MVVDAPAPIPFTAAIAAFAGAFLIGAWLLGRLLPWYRRRVLVTPGARSDHTAPTPQGAGLVLVPAIVAATVLAVAIAPEAAGSPGAPAVAGALAGALALCALGFADDVRPLPPLPRLIAMAVAAVGFLAILPPEARVFAPALPLALERAVLAVGLVWLVNAVNFVDGSDLITAAHAVPNALALSACALMGLAPAAVAPAALALAGALAGFALHNCPPARIFLGDAGSLPIGFLLGALWILAATVCPWPAALAALAYPALDATVTLVRRWRRGADLAKPHRDHFYQKARRAGVPAWRVAAIVATVSALGGGLAILCADASIPMALAGAGLALVAAGGAARYFAGSSGA